MPDFRAEVARRLAGLDVDPACHAEIVEELAQHLGDCYATARSRGLDDEAAFAAALAELSEERLLASNLVGVVRTEPASEPAIGAQRPRRWYASLWLDVRHATRSLRMNPGYAIIALLTLALGIGASTAIFSVVNAVMLRQLPYAQPEGLVRIWESNVEHGWPRFSLSQPNFLDFAERTRAFEHVAAYGNRSLALNNDGLAEMIAARAVSSDFLATLRVAPALGRDFTKADDVPGADTHVVLLMHGFWQRTFNGDTGVLGRTLVLDGVAHRVIGVLPQSFEWGNEVGVLMPLAADRAAERGDHRFSMIGRLAPGATLATARAELESIAAQLGGEYPETNRGWSVALLSFYDWLIPAESRQSLWVLAGAVGLLLLIACGNVANLMLARANARRRELAIRAALGADRGRIVAYLLVEALVLALFAGMLGVVFAYFSLKPLLVLGPDSFPRIDEVSIDATVALFALMASIVTGLLCGSIAALRALRSNLNQTLREGSQGSGLDARRIRGALVLLEMALSVALLIGAGLLIRSFWKLQAVDPGFATANLVAANINLPPQPYGDRPAAARFYEQLLTSVRALPGVQSAALSSMVPFAGGNTSSEVEVPGRDKSDDAGAPSASWRLVSPGYFAALGIPLRGRDFDQRDALDAPQVTIISERMAQLFWPNEDPIGKTVIVRSLSAIPVPIVGVVGDVRNLGLEIEPGAMVYVSALANPGWNPMQLVVRSGLAPEAQFAALRETLRAIDSNVPLYGVETVDDLLSRSLAGRRLNMYLLGCFATMALLLACVGLGGVIAYLVSQRTREIGIRMALGAPAREVFRLVVGHGMRLAFAGAAIGVLAALVLSRTMQGLLYAVSASDPLTFVLVPAVLLLVAFASCWWPARGAARVDPSRVLRNE